jgi:hypothetical protein
MFKVNIPQHLQSEEWVRMPKPGDRYMGLTRTTLLEIVLDPKAGCHVRWLRNGTHNAAFGSFTARACSRTSTDWPACRLYRPRRSEREPRRTP